LAYLRQTLVNGWGRAIAPTPGPIHFNCPFRDPLPPLPDPTTPALQPTWNSAQFFESVTPPCPVVECTSSLPITAWRHCSQGLIIAGPSNPEYPEQYSQWVSELSSQLGWPVLAEGLSSLRNYQSLNQTLVSTYDVILRSSERATALIPEMVIQLGPLPISKVLRQWLQTHQPKRWVVGSQRNLDPLHGPTQVLSTNLKSLVSALKGEIAEITEHPETTENGYAQQWLTYEKSARQVIDSTLATETALVESKVVWLLSQHLPKYTPLFIANSMPVRDVEYFWPLVDGKVQPVFSRGANGIDGTLSTAMGLAHHNAPTVLLTGDLAFLHDTNGLLNAAQLTGHLTIIVINNNGGGIFEMLPISQFESVFEPYFATPQSVELFSLCKAYGIEHHLVTDAKDFIDFVSVLPVKGMRVLEVVCDRKQSAQQRKTLLNSV